MDASLLVERFNVTNTSWRSSKTDTLELALINNAHGPFSITELSAVVGDFVRKRLSYEGDWALEITQSVEVLINEAANEMLALTATIPSNQSLPTLDATLRRLAGYMSARHITITRL